MNPAVTGCIPIFNHAAWCLDAIKSMATQAYDNLKIVVVDDGSTDNSFEVVKEQVQNLQDHPVEGTTEPQEIFSGLYEGRQIIGARFGKNYGPAISRNYMINLAMADTDIFAFLDSDDWYGPGKVPESVQYFLDNPFIGVVYSDYCTWDKDGNRHIQYKEPYSTRRLAQECLPNMDSLIATKCFKDHGLFDETLRVAEDLDRWLEFSKTYIFSHIPNYNLLNIRVGHHSSSATVPQEIWQDNVYKVRNKKR